MRKAIKNGVLIDESEAVLPVVEREVQYGYSVYEVFMVLNSKPIFLDYHIDRMVFSADAVGIKLGFTPEDLSSWIEKLIKAENIEKASFRVLAVGTREPLCLITYTDLKEYNKEFYENGIKVITYEGERFIPTCKTSNLLVSYLAYKEAESKGAFEALFVNRYNNLTEGTKSNIFAIRGNKLYGAPENLILSGITRKIILEVAAKELNLEIVEECIIRDNIFDYDALFISSTSIQAMPISNVDGKECSTKALETVLKIRDIVKREELKG